MLIGVVPGKYAQQIYDALTQRIDVRAEFVSPEVDGSKYDFVFAVDDEDVPTSANTRRYITHNNVNSTSWDVVAARHLLADAQQRGIQNPIAVPLPVASSDQAKTTQTGVALVENKQKADVTKALNKAGNQIVDLDDPHVGIVVDSSTTTSRTEPLRQAMRQEKVVVAMTSNLAATDTIHDKSDGRLIADYSKLTETVDELVNDDFERQRLGFEARKSVSNTNWARVTRALLLGNRKGMPVLEHCSYLAARKRWTERLGHAHRWKLARYIDNGYIELGDQRIDISQLSQLRKLNIATALGRRDPNSGNS